MPITLERLETLLIEHETCLAAIDEAIDLAKMTYTEADGEADPKLYTIMALLTNLGRLPRLIAVHERKLMRTNMKRNMWNREKARMHRRQAGIPERVPTSTLAEGKRYFNVAQTLNAQFETPEQQAEYAAFERAQQEAPLNLPGKQAEVTGIAIRAKERTKSPEERMREMLGAREEEPTLTNEEMAEKLFTDE